ncbi:MAG: hypothetical protein IKW77_11760 [Salinivirgaceae bacterium]|nr:hypothetical protein [Salinivirgaceae bacterium]
MAYKNIQEQSVKNKVENDWFCKFDCTETIGRIDFGVKPRKSKTGTDAEYLYWAEAKQHRTDIFQMLAQLILTIRADAYDHIPPKFIGCFDCEKIAFIEYHYILDIYKLNDFDWTQTPSSVSKDTIKTVQNTIDCSKLIVYSFDKEGKELQDFINTNFTLDANTNLLSTIIDKNNFVFVYQKWREMVLPYIDYNDWDKLKREYGIYDRDLFLAELNVDDNNTTNVTDDRIANHEFYITFDANAKKPYQMLRPNNGLETMIVFGFKKNGLEQYTNFWKRYKRPPQNEYWQYIIERLDLLVPQDVRERKGAFYTPYKWVVKSQEYIAKVLGRDWKDEYYIWDCCAGTGNLLNGLTKKYQIFASTIDQQDVDVMKERAHNTDVLLEKHIFQFDFLNDDFSKCPPSLQDIIKDPEKRKKLVIYINPPYAGPGSGQGKHKVGVSSGNKVYDRYKNVLGKACDEIFAQFFIRIYKEIPDCILAEFSTLKNIQSVSFYNFSNVFLAKLKSLFIVPASTFDNVDSDFPIGFFVWDLSEKVFFNQIEAEIFSADNQFICYKTYYNLGKERINDWLRMFFDKNNAFPIGIMHNNKIDFQHNSQVRITSDDNKDHTTPITQNNLIPMAIYLTVRQCFAQKWINNRDQFLFPNDEWKNDMDFQSDCLAYTLFHNQNRITGSQGVNHWIPFSEDEVNAKEEFASHFMFNYLTGKLKPAKHESNLFSSTDNVAEKPIMPIQFTAEAQSVIDAGRKLWRYYHEQPDANPNASLNDIRDYFKGKGKNGRRNQKSNDQQFTELDDNLKAALKKLEYQIRPKVYEYGFLKA